MIAKTIQPVIEDMIFR